jgi:uncharacterized cupredoxin-like copper-binding protein
MRTHRVWTVLAIAIGSVVLGVATTASLHAAGFARQGPFPARSPSCAAPALPGSLVDVTATDMGAMMGPGVMGPGMMGLGAGGTYPVGPGGGYRWPGMGMMRLLVKPGTVAAGPVSLRVTNTGMVNHEVVVLPLAPGQLSGQRVSGPDGKIDESGSVGEAARTCGAGDVDGIVPVGTGWTTLTLPAGRYELVCNIAGHYVAGMYAELDVVAQPN